MKSQFISCLLLVAAYGGPVNQNEFKEIIETVNTSGAKWKAGENFGENTTMAAVKRLLGARRDRLLGLPLRAEHPAPNSDIPESFDSRQQWPECESIRHIRDQGTCASSWAIAAAGAFTDRLCIATNGQFTLPLSAEELLTCCPTCGFGCDGGYQSEAWRYFATNGLVTGGGYKSNVGCQPYEVPACSHFTNGTLPHCDSLPHSETPKCQRKCTNPAYSKSFASDHQKIEQAYAVRGSVEDIQQEIMTHGPVEASFLVYQDFLTYKSGVYHHVTGYALGGHSVKIIGWGVEDGTPYWLVANQWNESWGDNGFFKILRGKDELGIETEIVAGVPKV